MSPPCNQHHKENSVLVLTGISRKHGVQAQKDASLLLGAFPGGLMETENHSTGWHPCPKPSDLSVFVMHDSTLAKRLIYIFLRFSCLSSWCDLFVCLFVCLHACLFVCLLACLCVNEHLLEQSCVSEPLYLFVVSFQKLALYVFVMCGVSAVGAMQSCPGSRGVERRVSRWFCVCFAGTYVLMYVTVNECLIFMLAWSCLWLLFHCFNICSTRFVCVRSVHVL